MPKIFNIFKDMIINYLRRNGTTPKEQWKKCSNCGIITDIDEVFCPQRGFTDSTIHTLQVVELGYDEISAARSAGIIWTKHQEAFRNRLSE